VRPDSFPSAPRLREGKRPGVAVSATMCGPIHSPAPLDSVVCLGDEVLTGAGSVLAEGVGGSVHFQADAVRVNRDTEDEAVANPVG